MKIKPLPCPFCGKKPGVFPQNPEEEGTCWGEVRCISKRCHSIVRIFDGRKVNDDRGSEKYKQMAIIRWNNRK